MKEIIFLFSVLLLLINGMPTHAQTQNELDSKICDAYKYALIRSLSVLVNKAIDEIYEDDDDAPERLSWDAYSTEIMKIKQIHGVGGAYEITLKVLPYYRAHITYGEDIIVLSAEGELIRYEHIKTYPKVNFSSE